jgi:hypothetical protein
MHSHLSSLVLSSLVVLGAACASSGAGANAVAASDSTACALQPKDSVFAVHAPVYRDCAVTTKATMISTGVHPDFTPPRGTTCMSAEYEFVVTIAGVVDVASARLIKTNSQQYADAMKQMLSRLKYEPAKRDGAPVAQITTLKEAAQLMTVVVPANSPTGGARPSPGRVRPSC